MTLRLTWLVALIAAVAAPDARPAGVPALAAVRTESGMRAFEVRVVPAAPGDRLPPLEERLDEVWDGEDEDDDDDRDSLPARTGGARAHPPGLSFGRLRPTTPPVPPPIARHCVPRSPPAAR